MPAVIYSHGYNGSGRDGHIYVEALTACGFVVYCYDFCGGSVHSRSDGKTTEMSIFAEQADLEDALAMVRNLNYVDTERIFLIGASQGGAVSAITAANNVDAVCAMALIFPAFVTPDEG